jgi:hypothetical protein
MPVNRDAHSLWKIAEKQMQIVRTWNGFRPAINKQAFQIQFYGKRADSVLRRKQAMLWSQSGIRLH